ncbi:hypothetical protein HYPSUDRAFT_697700 [Hypholoma sublateritium FD-334 SS-4]|uniref:Uncharacterized protein n=1 Tax=Hypholoma sublateritium (strain FD-334 SS-4) TaxID=945553 RepID=A0A0D2PBY3_HYPSF|nr:hypothetical protein HYPSUDRAFT_697700 [Hypholoma sublateritium FD-334 SS-4]
MEMCKQLSIFMCVWMYVLGEGLRQRTVQQSSGAIKKLWLLSYLRHGRHRPTLCNLIQHTGIRLISISCWFWAK